MYHSKRSILLARAQKSVYLILIASGIFSLSSMASAQQAYTEGNRLILPVATAGSAAYRVELTILDSTNPPELYLSDAESLDDPDTQGASYYSNGVLTVPSANVGNQTYWGQFALISENPITFRLMTADFDDDDDDNDGIPDAEDDEPYSAQQNDPLGIVGSWRFDFEIQSSTAGTACEDDPTFSFENTTITYDFQQGFYNFDGGGYNGPAPSSNNSIGYTASYPEDGGTTDRSLHMHYVTPNYMEGNETWSWSAPGEISCINILSSVTATRQ